MTGLEKMVSQILEEADASAAVMISDAEKKAAEILGEAGEKADKIRQQREEQSRAKVKSYEERTASAADMKKRTAVLAAKQELIGKVIADACDRVKNLDEGKYFEILKSMAEKYLLPREGEICFSKKDLERMPANVREEIKGLAQKKGGTMLFCLSNHSPHNSWAAAVFRQSCYGSLFVHRRPQACTLQDPPTEMMPL